MTVEADVAVVGSGVSGVLVARALVAAGRRVVIVERGGHKPHAEQLRTGTHATDGPGAQPSHEVAEGSPDYDWNYVFGVGGSTLHWTGVTPRFSSEDFRMRSAYGVMRDWPIGLDDLTPHYREAEHLLAVAGAPGGAGQPAHPFSRVDEIVAPLLAPYAPLPQARPTEAVGRRPPCCGSGVCSLCPVDSRFSVLNTFDHVLRHPHVRLLTDTAVERLVLDGARRRVAGLRCIGPDGKRHDVRAATVVVAAGGFENAGVLLRSQLARPDVGRFLFDHAHRTLIVRVARDVGAGHGATLSTGASNAYRDGDWRARAAAAYVSAYNPGLPPNDAVVEGILAGRRGREAHLEQWRRTIVLDVVLDDLPRADRRVTLSKAKDAVGLPRLRIAYGPPSRYEERGWDRTRRDLERRLRPLGVRAVSTAAGPSGSHQLGTCRMAGPAGDDGVVDRDLRHLDVENLYVTGGSAFPTYSPVHPTLTIAALALRLGEHLAG